ncbi:MAG: hypothetical protein VYE54_02545 [Pseudomonadota bacterium]|nr:hypothetical protein [Pseudomonadota bacterium]
MGDGLMRTDKEIETQYYGKFKIIRNKFRKYEPTDLIVRTLDYANQGNGKFENIQRRPWACLLLVKWILLDDNFNKAYRNQATDAQLLDILKLTSELESHNRMPDEYDSHLHFFRKYIHQQFIFQQPLSFEKFGRQFILFGDIEENHRIRKNFFKRHNIDINDFLYLALTTVARFHKSNSLDITNEWYSSISESLTKKLPQFFSATSKSVATLRKYLLDTQSKKRETSEFYEQSPLINSPFISINGSYWIPHRKLFFRSMENFIYNSLSEDSLEDFNRLFTNKFEIHTERVIDSAGLEYIREQELVKQKDTGKVVDFLIIDHKTKSKFWVEAKCVSASKKLMLNDGSMELLKATKANISKAIDQCCDIANWAHNRPYVNTLAIKDYEEFAIIITYGELHILSGEMFSHLTQSKIESEVKARYEHPLPMDRIFFASIGEFEQIIKAHIEGLASISETLNRIQEAEYSAVEGNKRMAIGQYLSEWGLAYGSHPLIVDRFSEEVHNLRRYMKR